MEMILVYITCSSSEEARKIGRILLEKRLAACINILPHMESLSLWPPKTGKIESANETVLLAKTMISKLKSLESEVAEIHSYDTPAIIAVPTVGVNKKYFDWISAELG
jgi:periplasmic divalent cation tolerance protein